MPERNLFNFDSCENRTRFSWFHRVQKYSFFANEFALKVVSISQRTQCDILNYTTAIVTESSSNSWTDMPSIPPAEPFNLTLFHVSQNVAFWQRVLNWVSIGYLIFLFAKIVIIQQSCKFSVNNLHVSTTKRNPCSNGMLTEDGLHPRRPLDPQVLILVLMEYL